MRVRKSESKSVVRDRTEPMRLPAQELEALRQTALDITAQLDRDRLLQTIIQRAVELLKGKGGGIYEYDPAQGELTVVADWGGKRSIVGSKLKVGESMAGRVVQMGKPLIVDDYGTWPGRAPIYEPDLFRAVVEVPLQWENRILGVLYVTDDAKDRVFTQRDAYLLGLLASQAAIAMENARLLEETQRRANNVQSLLDVTTIVASAGQLDEALQALLEMMVKSLPSTFAYIALLDKRAQSLTTRAAYPVRGRLHWNPGIGRSYPLSDSSGEAQTIETSQIQILHIEDPTGTQALAQIEERIKLDEKIKSACLVPLRSVNGQGFGIICLGEVRRWERSPFTPRNIKIAQAMADQTAILIERALLYEETHRRAKALEALHQTSLDLISYQRVPELVKSILERAVELLQAKGGGLYMLDESGEQVKLAAVSNLPEELVGMTLQVGDSAVGHVIETKAHLSVSNYRNWPHRLRQYDEYGFTAVAGTPIAWQDKIWGALTVHDDVEGRTFGQEDLDLLSHLGNLAAVALENARRMDELERLTASAIDAVIAVDEAGRVVQFNEQAEEILGYRAKEVLGQPVSPLYYDSEEARRVKRLLLESEDGRITDIDTSVTSKDGERIPIRLSASLLFDYEGKQAGSAGFFRDLREIQSAQRRIRQLGGLLAAGQAITSQLDLPSVLDSIATNAMEVLDDVDAIVLYPYDPDRGEFQVPPVIKGITQPEFILGSFSPSSVSARLMEIGEAHFADNAAVDPVMAGDFVTRESIASSAGVPIKVGDKIVGVMFFNYRESHPFSDEEKNVISILANQAAVAIENARLYEETHRRLKELERTKEMLAARTAVAWMGMVSSTWAHSIGRYTGTIRDYVEILRRKNMVCQELDEIEALAVRIQEIGDTRASSWEEVEIVEVNALLRELVRRLADKDGNKVQIRWQLDLTRDMTVKVSRRWLIWAIERVMENALEALAGSDTRALTIGSELHSGRVEVRISDTGTGMPEEVLSKLFKQPIPAKEKGARGSGVGLLLVSTILQSYGGDITVEATGPEGTTIRISLPLARSSKDEAAGMATERVEQSGAHVLLISEDQQWQRVLQEALEEDVERLEVVAEQETALLRIHERQHSQHPFAIIIADVHVIEDTATFIECIGELQPRAQVVFASAAPSWEEAKKSLRAGGVDHITKSLDRAELRRTVTKLLNRAQHYQRDYIPQDGIQGD